MRESQRVVSYKDKQSVLNLLREAVELIKFDTRIQDIKDYDIVLKETADKIFTIHDFIGVSFYIVDDIDNSFQQILSIPETYSNYFEEEYLDLVETGAFALALNNNSFKILASKQGNGFIVLHPIATPRRIHGMFIGLTYDNEYKFPEHAQYLLSLVLFACANLLDSFKLYNYLKNLNEKLQNNLQKLKFANIRLTQEIMIRKEKEIELRKSEEKYRSIIENLEDAYVELDLEGRIQFCNKSLSKMSGYAIEELIGRHFSDFTDIKYKKNILRDVKELFDKKIIGKYRNWKFYKKDGQELWVESLVSLKKDRDGKIVGFRTILRDKTKKIEYERRLKESEKKYRAIFESTGVPTLIVDFKGNIQMANNEVENLFGYTKREIEGKLSINNFLYNVDWDYIGKNCIRNLSNKYPQKIKCKGIDKNKEVKELIITVERLANTHQCIVSILDLTEQERLESQLRQARKFEALGILAGGIAHEFNNILQALRTQFEIMEHMKDKFQLGTNYFKRIDKLVSRAEVVVNRLLTFSRKKDIKMEPVDLNEVIKSSKELLRGGITKRISIDTCLSKVPIMVKGDFVQLEEVIVNLVNNSVDAIGDKQDGEIEIGVKVVENNDILKNQNIKGEEVACMWVKDNGCGISQKDLDRIFTPFYTTKEIGKGTGLGLAIVYGIVKSHNGYITCESEVGKGTIFQIYLPILSEEIYSQEGVEKSTKKEIEKIKAKVLVVDDEEMIREIVKDALEMKGIEVILAERGEEAISILKERGEFDLILMDVDMPGMGGVSCAKEILKEFPKQKIVLCSGYGKETVDASIKDVGIVDFIQKPFTLDKLFDIIINCLKKGN